MREKAVRIHVARVASSHDHFQKDIAEKREVEQFIRYLSRSFLPRVIGTEATTGANLDDAVVLWLAEIDALLIGGIRQTRQERSATEKPFVHRWIPDAAPGVRPKRRGDDLPRWTVFFAHESL